MSRANSRGRGQPLPASPRTVAKQFALVPTNGVELLETDPRFERRVSPAEAATTNVYVGGRRRRQSLPVESIRAPARAGAVAVAVVCSPVANLHTRAAQMPAVDWRLLQKWAAFGAAELQVICRVQPKRETHGQIDPSTRDHSAPTLVHSEAAVGRRHVCLDAQVVRVMQLQSCLSLGKVGRVRPSQTTS